MKRSVFTNRFLHLQFAWFLLDSIFIHRVFDAAESWSLGLSRRVSFDLLQRTYNFSNRNHVLRLLHHHLINQILQIKQQFPRQYRSRTFFRYFFKHFAQAINVNREGRNPFPHHKIRKSIEKTQNFLFYFLCWTLLSSESPIHKNHTAIFGDVNIIEGKDKKDKSQLLKI